MEELRSSFCKPLLKSAWEGFAFAPVQAEKLLWKFGELGKEPRRGCNANRITRNRNLGAHYTGVWGGVLGFRENGVGRAGSQAEACCLARTSSYIASGAISAPLGQVTTPSSRRACAK